MSLFFSLKKELSTYLPKEQIEVVHDAYLFSSAAHKKQMRSSGESFITHPLSVAMILAEMRMDYQSIVASILHDIIEDTNTTKETLEEKFGKEIANLVDGVSKLTQINFESKAEAQAENFRKMIIAMVGDIRVILIKLADRLHNMRTIEYLNSEKRTRIARETLEIYAPISNRLGMNAFRIELEELGFAALYPIRYKVMQKAVKNARGNRKEILDIIESSLREALKNSQLPHFKLKGREKHLYSIYKKMKLKHLSFSEVMDVYAFRIIVTSVSECYKTIGTVHNLYKPLPERFKDYIAIPKANGYQSLHTILFGPYGVPIEIQIRTEEMDKMAENGISAHWLYKSDNKISDKAHLRAREWIKGLLEIQQSTGTSLEFIENVKIDLFPDDVYVFTPKGDIMELPNGATAVDFAYSVHSDIGNKCVAVKIDRHLAPLSTILKNSQTVEIITSPSATPNPAWLSFVVTGKARSKIRYFLKHQQLSESISLGKRLIAKVLATQNLTLESLQQETIQKTLAASQFKTLDDLFEAVGLGNQMAQIVVRRLMDFQAGKQVEMPKKEVEPLKIRGTEGVIIAFAKCCRPIPGDPIEGLITTGHGIVIHHAACKNLIEPRKHPDKCISVSWETKISSEFEVELKVEVVNQLGILARIALEIAESGSNVDNVSISELDGHCILIDFIIRVRDRNHLAKVMRHIRKIKNVSKITRVQSI